MYWRNRLHKTFLKGYSDQILESDAGDIDDKVSYALRPPDDFDFNMENGDSDLPTVIIIQAKVQPTYYENPDVWVDARGKQLPLYKRDALNLPRCISKMKIIYDHIIVEEGKAQDWVKKCDIPVVIMDKQYDVLRKCTVKVGEKRLPQLKAGEQSLWSYGATYSTDKSTCQVQQKHFAVDFIDGNPFLKLSNMQGEKQLGAEFMNGSFSFFVDDKNNFIKKYSSFFIKDIATGFIHIHCREVRNDA